jgi:sugar phosphate isomerase/epimerase
MKLAFSTLGCPTWDLGRIAEGALRHGYDAVELRCLGGDVDLLNRPEMQPDRVAETRSLFAERGLEICCVDSSSAFHALDRATRVRNVEDAARHAELAARLGSPLVRVFPNEVPAGSDAAATRDRIVSALRDVSARAPSGVAIGLETHGDFATGVSAAEIVDLVDRANVGIVWDAANTFMAGEAIPESASAVSPRLLHVHLKDARPSSDERKWQPVLAGRGLVPFAEVIAALERIGYGGYVSFEWEKYWHPSIEDPDVAFADFRRVVAAVVESKR